MNYIDLIKNKIYNIDYMLIKEVIYAVYRNILNNFSIFEKDLISELSEHNDNNKF